MFDDRNSFNFYLVFFSFLEQSNKCKKNIQVNWDSIINTIIIYMYIYVVRSYTLLIKEAPY